MKKLIKFISAIGLLSVAFAVSAACPNQVGSTTSGTNVSCTDIFAPNAAKLVRPTGTNNVTVIYADNSTATVPNAWSSQVSGNAKVWHSYDGSQSAGNTIVSGMPAGYDAIAVVRANVYYRVGDVALKQAQYYLPGGNQVTLQTSAYLSWIFD